MSLERARDLRKRMTPQEVKLWVRLRELRPLGFHARRQSPIGGYVADFAFRRERLVVEIDGDSHALDPARDQRRDAALSALGYATLRVWNVDVDSNLDGVLEVIVAELESRRK